MAWIDGIETYCENGVWKSRWQHSTEPFATGGGKQRQICKGAAVAQWYGVDHTIKNPDASVAEHNTYRHRDDQAAMSRADVAYFADAGGQALIDRDAVGLAPDAVPGRVSISYASVKPEQVRERGERGQQPV